MTVHCEVGKRPVGIELRRQRLAGGLEVVEIRFGPPVGEPAGGIELAALVIEAVADLVPDNGAHGAIVVCRVGIRIEIRGLEDGRRKIQCVLQRQIDGVDRLGSHPPLVAIHRLVELGELALVFEQPGALRVAEGVPFDDFEARVILPPVGIADPDLQRLQLLFRFGLGLGRHPGERVNPPGERFHQILNHRLHLRLGLGREVALHVEPAHRLSERRVRVVHAPLPARAQLGNSAKGLAIEAEALVDEALGKEAAVPLHGMKDQPILPRVERLLRGQGG